MFNTHLSACYAQRWQVAKVEGSPLRLPRDPLAGVRLAQVLQLAAFVRGRASPASRVVVLLGDHNAAPDTLEMGLLRSLLPELADCWAQARPGDPGATANSPECSFTSECSCLGLVQPALLEWQGAPLGEGGPMPTC